MKMTNVEFEKRHDVSRDNRVFGVASVTLPDLCELIHTYMDLNDTGKAEAIKRIQELADLSQYKREKK